MSESREVPPGSTPILLAINARGVASVRLPRQSGDSVLVDRAEVRSGRVCRGSRLREWPPHLHRSWQARGEQLFGKWGRWEIPPRTSCRTSESLLGREERIGKVLNERIRLSVRRGTHLEFFWCGPDRDPRWLPCQATSG